MNPWLLPLVFLAAAAVGGLAYDLIHRGRRLTRDLGSLAVEMKRVGDDMEALADRCDPQSEPEIMPEIMPAGVELAAAVVGLIPESEAPRSGSVRSQSTASVGQAGPRSVSGSNGHRSKNRGRKRRR